MKREKIIEQFHYFNINADIDSVFGNWAVTTNGDVVNCLYPYAIFAIHLREEDWVVKMKTKIWFKPGCEAALVDAIKRALIIVEETL